MSCSLLSWEKLDIAGMDLLNDGDNYKVCEGNCAFGFQAFELSTTIKVPDEIYNDMQTILTWSNQKRDFSALDQPH